MRKFHYLDNIQSSGDQLYSIKMKMIWEKKVMSSPLKQVIQGQELHAGLLD